ncbi:MAG: TolC family protein, partial [Tepidisphaeraceae bacterium]
MKRIPILVVCGTVALVALSGCSAAHYQKWADQQVDQIIRDRAEETLDYVPEVEARVDIRATPTTHAFAKVPLTPKAPPTTAPIEPSDLDSPYGPLGPAMLFPASVTAPQQNGHGLDIARYRVQERLALGPPSPRQEQPVRIDLFGSIQYAVQNARDYKNRMEDLYLVALDVTLERHLFEPRPFARTGARYTGGQKNVDYDAALTVANSLGVRQRLPYGGEIVAEAAVDFVQALNGNVENAEPATLALTASIPLLRGAGMVNLEGLIQSERDVIYSIRQFEDYRRSFVVNIASQYFQLLADQQSIADRGANLISLQQLTARSQALYAAQRVNYIDVQRALQEQLQAENQLVAAQARFRSSLDNFKLQLGMPVDQPLEVVGQELAVEIPAYAEPEVAVLAQKYRLDLTTAQDRVEDARRGVQNAKNGLLPDLDLAARGTIGNNDDEPARRIHSDTAAYSAGVELEIPIDRLGERNAYRASLIRLERSQRSYDQLKDEVAADAREALRLIRAA